MLITSVFALLLSTASQARMNETILCPSIDTIHQIAPLMKNAEIYFTSRDNVYYATISGVKANGLTWQIYSGDIIANYGKKEVAIIAAYRSAAVSHLVYPNARFALRDGQYSCLYYDVTQPKPFVSIIAVIE